MSLAKNFFSSLIIFGILLAVCIFGALYFFNGQEPTSSIKEDTSSSKNMQTVNEPKAEQEPKDIGSNIEPKIEQESSVVALAEKVTIKAYLNLGACGKEVTDLLDGLVKEYQGRVSVEYIDFGTSEGAKRMAEDGLNCQGLVINGKQTYVIKDSNGEQREVTFSHPINTQYTADDLKTVIKLLLGK
jgi:hypothetical protein